MKYIYLILFMFFCVLSVFSNRIVSNEGYVYNPTNDTSNIAEPKHGIFKIEQIKKQKGVYIVQSYNVGDSLQESIYHTIISKKPKARLRGLKKIKVGHEYEMLLNPYLEYDYFPWGLKYNITIDGETIGVVPWGYNIYTTTNLNGLYYYNTPPK